MRLAFLGSPPFAVPCFEYLCQTEFRPLVVVTPPDRPKGRGRRSHSNPLSHIAETCGVPHVFCANAADNGFLEELRSFAPEWVTVVSFGQILKNSFLSLPSQGCLNVHASLLPRHRGASPIAAAIRQGDRETGITIQRVARSLDTGDILLAKRVEIPDRCTTGELTDLLADMAGPVLCRALESLENGTGVFTPQDHEAASYAGKLTKEDGRIDWSLDALEIDRHVRSMTPWPGAWTELPLNSGGTVTCVILEGHGDPNPQRSSRSGVILGCDSGGISLSSGGEHPFVITRLKPASGKSMSAGDFLRGRPLQIGGSAG